MKRSVRLILIVCLSLVAGSVQSDDSRPFMATGFKICEVSTNRAIIWTRLTREASRASGNHPQPDVFYIHPETGGLVPRRGRRDRTPVVVWPAGYDIGTIDGAALGTTGEVRVSFRPVGSEEAWTRADWARVDPDRDFTTQIRLVKLEPATAYELRIESRKEGLAGQMLEGSFRTAPPEDDAAKVVFTVVTGQGNNGQDSRNGFRIYPQMRKLNPDFFVNTGDILYYDSRAKTLPLARWHWQRVFSFKTQFDFHQEVPSYFIKDDHDTWMNDCWPGQVTKFMGEFTFDQGKAVFLEQVGMGERTWRPARWGKDLQIWMVEGRDYRSPNPDPDGPKRRYGVKSRRSGSSRP